MLLNPVNVWSLSPACVSSIGSLVLDQNQTSYTTCVSKSEIQLAERTQEPHTSDIFPTTVARLSVGHYRGDGHARLFLVPTVRLVRFPRLERDWRVDSRERFPRPLGRTGRVISALAAGPVTPVSRTERRNLDADAGQSLCNSHHNKYTVCRNYRNPQGYYGRPM